MCELFFIAYIPRRADGGPDRVAVRSVPATVAGDGEWEALLFADPKSAYGGAHILGTFSTREDAEARAQDAWESLTELDARGCRQWAF